MLNFSIPRFIHAAVARFYLKKPELAEFLAIRIPDLRSLLEILANRLHYILHSLRAPSITSIQFELTNFCNLRCTMCPVNNGMKRKKTYMDFDLFKKVMDENPNVGSVLLFCWGESLMHKEIWRFFEYFRGKKNRVYLSTNAVLLTEETMRRMLGENLTRVAISLDGLKESYEKIRGYSFEKIEKTLLRFIELRDALRSPLKIEINMVIDQDTEPLVPEFLKRWEGKVDRIQIQPVITFRPSDTRRRPRCFEPWRGNAVILADGTVTTCCVDYEGVFNFGNARDETLAKIWNGPKMKAFRASQNKRKWHPVCQKCTEYSTRLVNPRFV
ncbi:MAG: radical SAM protein [Candidatus Omnitrophota bacterium]